MHVPKTARRMSRGLLGLAMVMALTVAAAAPAFAGVERNPNVVPFGPIICDDGREIAVAFSPTGPAAVAFASETGTKGVAKSVTVIVPVDQDDPLGDNTVIEVLFDRPGKGLDRNTVRCAFPVEIPNVWVAVEVIFTR